MSNIGHPTPPLRYASWENAAFEIALRVQSVMQGKLNNGGEVTLTASDTTTTVTDERVGANSRISLTATTANAAAALATTYVSSKGEGTFTLTHASNAQADRTLDYAVSG